MLPSTALRLLPSIDPQAHPDNGPGSLNSVQGQEVPVEQKQGLPVHPAQSCQPKITKAKYI